MNGLAAENSVPDNGDAQGVAVSGVGRARASSTKSSKEIRFQNLLRQKNVNGKFGNKEMDLRVWTKPVDGKPVVMVLMHKDLFVMASSCFSAMLNQANLSNDGSYSIRLDISGRTFLFVKHFMYFKELPEQVQTQGVTVPLDMTMQLEILEVSVDYEIDLLKKNIVGKIKQSLNKDDAFKVLEVSREREVKELEALALDMIYKNAVDLFADNLEDFCKLGLHDVIRILSSDLLECEEAEVFQAAFRWAEAKASYAGPSKRKSATKYYFSQVSHCVRFPHMTATELAQITAYWDIIDSQDLVKLFQYISLPEEKRKDIRVKFETKPRIYYQRETAKRVMPPTPTPPLFPNGFGPAILPSSAVKRSRLSGDGETVVSLATTTTSKPKKSVGFAVGGNSDEDSDDELFTIIKRQTNRTFLSYEDLSRRFRNEDNATQVGGIELSNVVLTQNYRPLVFPSCNDFKLDAICNFIRGDKLREKDFKNFIKGFDLMRYLVFHRKDYTTPLTAEQIWSMDMDILLKFNGVTFLKLRHPVGKEAPSSGNEMEETSSGHLVLNYLRDSCAILNNDKIKISTLAMSNCEFSSQVMKDRAKQLGGILNIMILYRVWGDYTLDEVMRNYPNLTELIVWKYTPQKNSLFPKGSALRAPLSLNFSHVCPALTNIRKLVLFQSELSFSGRSNALTSVSELHLGHCYVVPKASGKEQRISSVFHQIFPKLKRFVLVDARIKDGRTGDIHKDGNMATADLVDCVRSKIKTIEWFRVVGLNWNCEAGNTAASLSYDNRECEPLQSFLKGVKVSSNSTNFLLNKVKGSWTGKDFEIAQYETEEVDGGYHSMMDKLEYEWYNLHHFYDHCETYEDYMLGLGKEEFPTPALCM